MSAPLTELIANQSIPVSATALTTLTRELKAGETTIEVGAAAPTIFQAAESQFRVLVDSEIIVIEASSSSTTKWKILERKAEQSTEAAHAVGVSVFARLTVGALKNWQTVASGVQNARLYCAADGVTDDSTNFLKMLEAGKDILIPGNTTILLNHVEFPANMPKIRIGGTGTLKWAAGPIGGAESMFHLPSESFGLTFEDLTLDGSMAGGLATALEGITAKSLETKSVDFIEGSFYVGAEVMLYEMGTTNATATGTVESITSNTIKWVSGKEPQTTIAGVVLMYIAPILLSIRGARHVFQNVAILNPPGRGYFLVGGRTLLSINAETKTGSSKLAFSSGATSLRAGLDIELIQASTSTTLAEELKAGGLIAKVASSTGFAPGQKIILSANSTARYEEVYVQDVIKSGEILLTAPCEKAHTSGDAIWLPRIEINIIREVKSSTEALLRNPVYLSYPVGALVKMSETQHIEVHGGSIVGTGMYGYGELSADLSSVPVDCKVDNVDIDDTGWAGIAAAGNRFEVSDCRIRRPGWINPHQDGITFYGTVEPEDILITGGEIVGSYNHGIHGSGHRIHIIGVKIIRPNFNGIYLDSAGSQDCFFGAIIEGCEIIDAGNSGQFGISSAEQNAIQVVGYSDLLVADNLIDSPHINGIYVQSNEGSYVRVCTQVVVEGNAIQTPVEGTGIRCLDVNGMINGGRVYKPGEEWAVLVGDSGELKGYKTTPQRIVTVTGLAVDTLQLGTAIQNNGNYTTLNLGPNTYTNTGENKLARDEASSRVEPAFNRIAPQLHDKTIGKVGIQQIGIGATLAPPYGIDEIEILFAGTIKAINNNHPGRRLTLVFKSVEAGSKVEAGEHIILKEAYEAKVAGHTLTLLGDGINWYEVGRS